jgi:hypothetical protein
MYRTWPVPGEFYRDYIAAWLGPVREFTFAQQRCVNTWNRAVRPHTAGSCERLVENASFARLPTRRIRLPGRTREFRTTPPVRSAAPR